MSTVKGEGLLNSLINKLPIELHLPGYQYCGPGTKLSKRLQRGDLGVNQLDKACKQHDIAYSQHADLANRHKADRILEDTAWSRVKSRDANFGERAAAWAVTNVMKVKRKMGMGLKRKQNIRRRPQQRSRNFTSDVLRNVIKTLKPYKGGKISAGVRTALKAARIAVKNAGGRKRVKKPRILPLPKTGGILPLIPIFSGLSALGSLVGGVAGIVRAVKKTNEAQAQMTEAKRHNKVMEEVTLTNKKGSGLYLKPYRKGLGLYIRPYSKNQ